jgi:hypothetical protein
VSPEADDAGRPTATPFLAALAIVVIVVIAIGLINLLRDDRLSEDQRVERAAVGQNDALQRRDFDDFRAFTCRQLHSTESDVLARQDDSVAKRGTRFVDDVTNMVIDGDRATATVTYHFDKAPDDKKPVETTFVREDGSWKVCSTGPS